jgi:hypothetical protein
VQCMQLGNKLIITANLGKSVTKLYSLFCKTASTALVDVIMNLKGADFKDARNFQPQASRKREELLDALDDLGDLATRCTDEITVLADFKSCVKYLNEAGAQIIFLQPAACHAEQNFLLILAEHNILTVPPFIAGKKRPCASCWLTLMMFKKYWLGTIEFIPRGGHYFEEANQGVNMLIQIGLRQGKFTFREIHEWIEETIAEQQSHTSFSRSTKGDASDKGTSEYGSETEEDEEPVPKRAKKRRKLNPDEER